MIETDPKSKKMADPSWPNSQGPGMLLPAKTIRVTEKKLKVAAAVAGISGLLKEPLPDPSMLDP